MERTTARRSSLTRMEDQIAAVGGRKRAAPSGALQKLEDDLLGRSLGRVSVTAKSYDAGAPIELRYRQAHYTVVPETSPASAWSVDRAFNGVVPYTVEPYEAPPVHPAHPGPACHPAPVAPGHETGVPVTTPAAPTSPVDPEPAESPPGTASSPEKEAAASQEAALTPALGDQIDDFEADIRAILAQGGVTEPERPASEPARPGEPSPPEAPAEDTHAVFDQMGRNMQYANTFNLGAIELDQRFDAFERDLDRGTTVVEPASSIVAFSAPSNLDDLDVLADIIQIGERAPEKKPETGQGSVLVDGGGAVQETPATGPALRAGPDEATEETTNPGRLVAAGESPPESAPPAADDTPSIGIRNPDDAFDASRQGTLIVNQ